MHGDRKVDMEKSVDTWTKELVKNSDGIKPETAQRLVRDIYSSAQKDLLEQVAQAEYEREE
ncbi:hypothetical protein [Streptomyces sp. NBC_00316]|uniref:hypothetical protein n=1 Tax=Streptomyces sp. NBC_00316 TaxID=2975710 RepID=UPI002E2A88BA|nr:hypothetical protein [Streptomyces sp. NBC_00316]